jgi:hypothetical protein
MPFAMLALALPLVMAQATSQSFAGTWVAEHAGTTFIRLELRPVDGKLEGRISLGNLRVDANGMVAEVTATPAALTPIFDVALKGSTLAFASKEGDDIDRFEVKLTGGEAELHFFVTEADRQTLAAEGVPVPKPVRLKKIAP